MGYILVFWRWKYVISFIFKLENVFLFKIENRLNIGFFYFRNDLVLIKNFIKNKNFDDGYVVIMLDENFFKMMDSVVFILWSIFFWKKRLEVVFDCLVKYFCWMNNC